MAFRFKIINDGAESFTPWYEEANQMAAPMVAKEIRMEMPDSSFSIERKNVRPDKRLDVNALSELLTQTRRSAGWSDEEIAKGVRHDPRKGVLVPFAELIDNYE